MLQSYKEKTYRQMDMLQSYKNTDSWICYNRIKKIKTDGHVTIV